MGNRLSKIYTRTGDDGTTGLGDGSRVSKDSLRVEAIGAIDELNSQLGLLLSHSLPASIDSLLTSIQHELFDLGGEISIPGHKAISSDHVVRLEAELDHYNSELSPLKEFILPGGSQVAAHCHVSRATCRRAERRLISLQHEEDVSKHAVGYLNRLSDLLFVLARSLNASKNVDDVLWQPASTKGKTNKGNIEPG